MDDILERIRERCLKDHQFLNKLVVMRGPDEDGNSLLEKATNLLLEVASLLEPRDSQQLRLPFQEGSEEGEEKRQNHPG